MGSRQSFATPHSRVPSAMICQYTLKPDTHSNRDTGAHPFLDYRPHTQPAKMPIGLFAIFRARIIGQVYHHSNEHLCRRLTSQQQHVKRRAYILVTTIFQWLLSSQQHVQRIHAALWSRRAGLRSAHQLHQVPHQPSTEQPRQLVLSLQRLHAGAVSDEGPRRLHRQDVHDLRRAGVPQPDYKGGHCSQDSDRHCQAHQRV